MAITVKWDEDEEFDGFEGDADEIPRYARQGKNACAIISGGDVKFEEPIWLHPEPAYEMAEAHMIEFDEAINDLSGVDFDGVTIYIYTAPEARW